jgi:hypothetical protein
MNPPGAKEKYVMESVTRAPAGVQLLCATALVISLGRGLKRPTARRVPVADVAQFAEVVAQHTGPDAWVSPCIWDGDHRRASDWAGAAGVVLDIDYYSVGGGHGPPPAEARRALAAQLDLVPCLSFAYETPRGHRVGVAFDTLCSDSSAYLRALATVAADVDAALTTAGVLGEIHQVPGADGKMRNVGRVAGYVVDRAASRDLARMFWAPNAHVEGEPAARNATVQVLSLAPVSVSQLAARAPVGVSSQRARTAPPLPPGVSRQLQKALATAPGASLRGDRITLRCPVHDDANASAVVFTGTGVLHCSACGENWAPSQWLTDEWTRGALGIDEEAAGALLRQLGNGSGRMTAGGAVLRAWPAPPDPAAFHGLAGDFVRVVEPHSEADRTALLLQFVVGVGNVVGPVPVPDAEPGEVAPRPYYLAEADQHPTNLFLCLVGETSKGRKGTSWGHVRALLSRIDEEWGRDRIKGGLSSGEGLIWEVRDVIIKQVPVKEGGKILGYQPERADHGVADKRLLVVETELGSTLRVLKREGNTLSGIVRQAWDTGTLRAMTKNNPAVATGAHISIIGHVTRDELVRHLDDVELANGFANRFLMVCVKRSKLLPEGGSLAPEALGAVEESLRLVIDHARTVDQVKMTDDARALWRDVYPVLSEGRPGLLGSVTGRSEAQVVRLALIYALLDRVKVIGRDHLQAALAVWHYAERSAAYLWGGGAVGDPMADRVLAALRASQDGLTRTEVRDLFSHATDAKKVDQAMSRLEGSGLARKHSESTKGRPVERWTATVSAGRDQDGRDERQAEAPASVAAPRPASLSSYARLAEAVRMAAADLPPGVEPWVFRVPRLLRGMERDGVIAKGTALAVVEAMDDLEDGGGSLTTPDAFANWLDQRTEVQ